MGDMRRRNHYVPQFYLKHWAVNDKICVYNNLVSNEKVPMFQSKVSKSIAYLDNLYTDIRDLEETDAFEVWISEEVEQPYQHTEQKILNGIRLQSQDYKNLVRYAMAQFWRVPYNYFGRYTNTVETLEPLLQKTLERTMSSLSNRIRYNKTDYDFENKIPEEDIPIKLSRYEAGDNTYLKAEVLAGRKSWLNNIKRMVDNIAEKTSNHKWQIIPSIEGATWLTSDNPVSLLNYYSATEYNFEGAWNKKNTDIFMPISPQYLLFTQVGSRVLVNNDSNFQTMINQFIIENSFLQIYSTEQYSYIPTLRKRIVNADEYKRIYNLLKLWHPYHISNELSFWNRY